MEEKDSVIADLREKIKSQDRDIYFAATYGKQLVEEKKQLTAKIEDLGSQKEVLEQEKHSLQLQLEAKIQALNSQTHELEFQRDQSDNLQEKLQTSTRENEDLLKKIENLRKDNQYLKTVQEDLNVENKSLKDKLNLLMKQMRNFEDQAEKSLCEADKDETQELQAQLNVYMLNNKELQEGLSQVHCELEMAKKNENHLLQMVQELEETLRERTAEISSLNAEIKVSKEECEELQAEIEILKFDQVDVNRRGNSVFAELDDRRNLVEREYKILRKKFEDFQKTYDENKKELDKARVQMLILQTSTSRQYQETYINQLEDSLASAKMEIRNLTHKLSKVIKSNTKDNDDRYHEGKGYDYLRVMLNQLREKEKELQNEVLNLKTQSMCDNDKLTEVQGRLYKTREDLDSAKQEILTLKQKVKELEMGIMLNQPVEPVIRRPKIEILDGFKPPAATESNEQTVNLNKTLIQDPDIIPGEIELGEDGFKQIKRSRKSNKFVLREFNKIEPDEKDSVEDCLKSSERQKNSVDNLKNETVSTKASELKPKESRNYSKISRSNKHDNCAQQ